MSEQPTQEQQSIIEAPADSHIKVPAGPGSGKSSTMRHRVVRLLSSGVPARKTLVVMFNKSAQVQFSKKLSAQLSGHEPPQIRTFHALGLRICQTLEKSSIIKPARLDTSPNQARIFAKQALREVVGDTFPPGFNPHKAATIEEFVDFVGLVKTGLDNASTVFSRFHLESENRPFIEAYDVFENLRKNAGIRFFSDLIHEPVSVLMASDSAKNIFQGKLDQIIIDEYQDINAISQKLIVLLAGDTAKVTAVGDDSQTLYGFRGSRPDYLISQFDADFPNPHVFKLTTTFRFGHTISLASNSLIRNNRVRLDKTCLSHKSAPMTSVQWLADNGKIDKNPVVDCVREWVKTGRKLSEMAILVRLFATAPSIELALLSNGIAYRLSGGVTVLDSFEARVLSDLLLLADGKYNQIPADEKRDVVQRILSFPHAGLNAEQFNGLINDITNSGITIPEGIRKAMPSLPGFIAARLQRVGHALESLVEDKSKSPYELLSGYLVDTECYKRLTEMAAKPEDAETQITTLQAFTDFCRLQGNSINELLATIGQMREAQHQTTGNRTDAVLITSVHRAKGLEWPHVLMPALAESTFPYEREGKFVDIESERRLFYVGMTRAQELLTLISPEDPSLREALSKGSSRAPSGIEGNSKRASRFLYEADLRNSSILGRAISNQSDYTDLPKDNAELYNSYLKLAGSTFRIG